MARRSSFDILTIQTYNTALIWKDVHGIAPDNAAKKLDIAMLDWQSELTKTLKIWIDKGLDMTVGELILARAQKKSLPNTSPSRTAPKKLPPSI